VVQQGEHFLLSRFQDRINVNALGSGQDPGGGVERQESCAARELGGGDDCGIEGA